VALKPALARHLCKARKKQHERYTGRRQAVAAEGPDGLYIRYFNGHSDGVRKGRHIEIQIQAYRRLHPHQNWEEFSAHVTDAEETVLEYRSFEI
jgi:hypothetical protein